VFVPVLARFPCVDVILGPECALPRGHGLISASPRLRQVALGGLQQGPVDGGVRVGKTPKGGDGGSR